MAILQGLKVEDLYSLFKGTRLTIRRKFRNSEKEETYAVMCTTRFAFHVSDKNGKHKIFKWEDYGVNWVAIEIM